MRLKTLLGAAIMALCAATFSAAQEGDPAQPAPDSAEGLKAAWANVLARAQAGEEEAVKELLSAMVMTEEDFVALFGDEKGKELAPKYLEKYAQHWSNEAKNITAKVKERGYDDVEVTEVTAGPEHQSAEDKKVTAALKEGTKMFSVRLKKKGEKAGLRYDSFFFVNGGWKTGLKLGKLLGGAKGAEKAGSGESVPPPEGGK